MGEPSRVRVTGPLEPFAAGFIFELQESGYRPTAAAVQVRVLAHLSGWMQEQRVSAEGLREPELERFRREHLARVASVRGAGMTVVLGHLRRLGVVPAQQPVTGASAPTRRPSNPEVGAQPPRQRRAQR
jgi:integrase/recombinase XerD